MPNLYIQLLVASVINIYISYKWMGGSHAAVDMFKLMLGIFYGVWIGRKIK